MNFRADINGLRAIAVLAVLGFHFGIPGFNGGFVGVDVFFVISGYLMTGIFVKRFDRGTFSISGFYLDRARRIIPPLAVLVAVLLVAGTICLLPQEFLVLGKHSAGSVLFVSNILFWKEAGYFTPSAKLDWLLHTWSLSVEWQFYIIYPLLLLLLSAIGGRRLLSVALAFIAVISFAFSIFLTAHSPTAAFYLLPSRAWEMIVGGMVLLAPAMPVGATRVSQLMGVAAILASIVFADPAQWPGVGALAPVVGAALVIAANRTVSRITGNSIASWVGLNSYSIYLWHWPLAVIAARYGLTGDWRAIVPGIIGALIIGHLSWRFVERGGRRAVVQPHIHTVTTGLEWRRHIVFASVVGALAMSGAIIWKARGLPGRFSPQVQALEADNEPGGAYNKGCFDPSFDKAPCIIGASSGRIVAQVIGDSHADADVSALVAALPPHSRLIWSGYHACPPLLDGVTADPDSRCDSFIRHDLLPLMRPRTVPVILISHWNGSTQAGDVLTDGYNDLSWLAQFRARAIKTSCALAKAGPTYVMLSTPDFPFPVASTLQQRLIADPRAADINIPLADHRRRLAAVNAIWNEAARECGIILLDPTPYICPDGKHCMGSIGHRAIFRDAHHMSEFGNKLLIPMFKKIFLKESGT
ncbi:acyltransferase family protein [Novosphingobium resinovorum]|uniref:acyltransferase family protein n=1 Tax=Novosphingobium TaxID=165696 RepID=UPI001B3C8D2D|nr:MULTISPECIES: acyltransferase family protein [Novosphingobium]WJM29651.1 acyltransferase family protein [Novosphingobium resinovorum]